MSTVLWKRLLLALILLASCRGPFDPTDYNPDWTLESHGESPPNYALVVPQDSVNRIDIIMTAARWADIRKNMTDLWGFDFGAHRTSFGPFPTGEAAYVDVLVRFNGKAWNHVGFRLKGNATLQYSWNQGIYKLPFRLKFDEFEDRYPETWSQRLYGFSELTMANNAYDETFIREKAADDVFRMAGVAAARAAFYRVHIDFGQGLTYNGLYTMVEAIEDNMLRDQFGENGGNLYKPDSRLKQFLASEFPRRNNTTSTDYSDVQALITALNNNSLRTGNPAQWRASLEAVFNVDHFLNYLAVNTALPSQDAYGINAHNFYLYHHSSRKLTWVPWDQNAAFFPGGLSIGMTEVDGSWPLIRFLLDDPLYHERYRTHMRTFYDTVFAQATMDGLFDKYHGMIAPYVVGPQGELPEHTFVTSSQEFADALPWLKDHVASRRALLEEFLR